LLSSALPQQHITTIILRRHFCAIAEKIATAILKTCFI
jgi:hypothetical protein